MVYSMLFGRHIAIYSRHHAACSQHAANVKGLEDAFGLESLASFGPEEAANRFYRLGHWASLGHWAPTENRTGDHWIDRSRVVDL